MSNLKTYSFNYGYKNISHTYNISIDLELFKPGADSLYFINKPDVCIAQISIGNFTILLRPVGSCILIDEQQGKTYNNFLPNYLYELLDINAEYNLNKLDISIIERNHFEFVLYKKEKELLTEYSFDLHKHLITLDTSLDSFIEELKSVAIFFIQEDFINSFDYSDEDYFTPCFADDDFDSFTETSTTEVIYSTLSF